MYGTQLTYVQQQHGLGALVLLNIRQLCVPYMLAHHSRWRRPSWLAVCTSSQNHARPTHKRVLLLQRLALLQGSKVSLHPGDAQDPDVANDIMLLPDTETLADRPKPCLAEVASLPRDWARLFDGQLFCIGGKAAHAPAHWQLQALH
jgi:hypothetical protein